jgi:hypothetical protein
MLISASVDVGMPRVFFCLGNEVSNLLVRRGILYPTPTCISILLVNVVVGSVDEKNIFSDVLQRA